MQALDDVVKRFGSFVALGMLLYSIFIGQSSPAQGFIALGVGLFLALWTWWRADISIWPGAIKNMILILIIAFGLGAIYGIWWGFGGPVQAPIAGAVLGAVVFVAIVAWWKWWRHKPYSPTASKYVVLALILAIATGAFFWLWHIYPLESLVDHPTFEITAVNALPGDKNAFELNDHLIWEQDKLEEYGIALTYTLQIIPIYNGDKQYGIVEAIISGEGGQQKKTVWTTFDKDSKAEQIHLTLPEILKISGLKTNTDSPNNNPFQSGDLFFEQAKLTVAIAPAAENPWDSEEIVIRNAPWELRADRVWRNNRHEADVYVKNLGGAGNFTVRYFLVRLDKEIGPGSHPMNSGTTTIKAWNNPRELVYLEKDDVFTDTVVLPSPLSPGRYVLEIFPVKEQAYVTFKEKDIDVSWGDLNSMACPWCFGGWGPMRYQRLLFLDTDSDIPIDETVNAELTRLREAGNDLGFALEAMEEITSFQGTVGQHQVFQKGEVYVHDGQAYALYGPILEYYQDLGGVQHENLGFPISAIQAVTSSLGTEGTMMEFEGPGSGQPPTIIYASAKGVGITWRWIGAIHMENGGYRGWLGFPLVKEQYYAHSTSQMFENGYIVYQYPNVNGEPDWSRAPVAYPYLASRGTLVDVDAQQTWQDSGVKIRSGERVTIIQTGGVWSIVEGKAVDANGATDEALHESFTLPSVHPGVLIGRIGESNAPIFPVGRWSTFIAQTEGSLYLAMNDNEYNDNSGFITVQVMVEDVDNDG